MNREKLFLIAVLAILASSCGSSRKGSSRFDDSASPYVKEVTVREEKVRTIDQEDVVYGYYVIIGSFKVVENARNFRTSLTKESFAPVILENENGLFRVSVAAYNDEKAARNRIAQIRNNYEKYSDVWLLIRK
ncbi:MAG: SPOR domain-containing protein [Cytophagaceae bacterium]|jgi:cell division protein FtsN|nr:SPOR domain-containing protein [Cytophagaceae bacterium]